MEQIIFIIIQSVFIFLSYILPSKCDRKDIGISASIVILVVSLINLLIGFNFLNAFLSFLFEVLVLIFVIYWALRILKYDKTARGFVIVIFLSFTISIILEIM